MCKIYSQPVCSITCLIYDYPEAIRPVGCSMSTDH